MGEPRGERWEKWLRFLLSDSARAMLVPEVGTEEVCGRGNTVLKF